MNERTMQVLLTTAREWGGWRAGEFQLRRLHGEADSVGSPNEGAAKRPHRGDVQIPRGRMARSVGAGATKVEGVTA